MPDAYSGLTGNLGLTSLDGIGSVAELFVTNNGLSSLSGLEGFTSLRALTLENNISLTSLAGAEDLTEITEDLIIDNNNNLTDLTALYGLTLVGGDLTVVDNDDLTDTAAQSLADEIDLIGGAITISGN